MEQSWLSIKQTSKYLNVSPSTVRRLINAYQIRTVKLNHTIRIDYRQLQDFIDRNANIPSRRINK